MQQANSKTLVSVENISKSFGKTSALVNVDLEVYEGEILSVLGPNGAGKTTLISMMLGRISPTKGRIRLLGHSPGEVSLKRQCGAMLQVARLPDMTSVKEYIELFQSYYGNPMGYSEIVKVAGLSNIENKLSNNLSGGQKQRLLFALSICGNPKLLFLDEPTVGLDISARHSLWKSISKLKKNGTSVILTTHYLEEADQLSDRIVMLNNGRVIKVGTPTEIKTQVQSKTIRFTCAAKLDRLNEFQSIKKVLEKPIADGRFCYDIQSNRPVETLRRLFDFPHEISELTVSGAALEDAFLILNDEVDSSQGVEK